MSAAARDGAVFQHRAQLFPLPLLAAVARPSHTSSQGVRFRFKLQRTIVAVTNRAICALNRLYFPSHHVSSHFTSQPDNNSLSCSCCRPSADSSAAQLRTLAYLRQQCRTFVLKASSWATHLSPCLDISPSTLDMLASIPSAAGGQPRPPPASTAARAGQDSLLLDARSDFLSS